MVTDFIVLTQTNGELVAFRADKIDGFYREKTITNVSYQDGCFLVLESVEEIIKLIDNCK